MTSSHQNSSNGTNYPMMAAHSPYTTIPQRNSSFNDSSPRVEDCRDFLRTGRCKYGASCKYNHPANVQSGGGMKTPIDPSEPLFPLRPNEPVCQYFVKHGTCKFGQACKFHHPPQMAGTGNLMNSSNTVLVSLPIVRKPDGTMWTAGNDLGGVQILPQRPDEPNCIYFLKNGRCKFGATCRYHHPLNFHDRNGRNNNLEENGRHHQQQQQRHAIVRQDSRGSTKVHYVTALPPGSMQHGHFVVTDGAVTFVSLDGATPTHVVPLAQSASGGNDGQQIVYTTTPGTVTSSSSSTSIASSFETAVSALDANDSSSSLWNRKPVTSSAQNGYNASPETSVSQARNHILNQGSNRTVFVQSVSEGGVVGMPRVMSAGSTSDGSTIYFDTSGQPQTDWRPLRSSSFDQTRSRATSFQGNEMQRSMSVHSALDGAERPLAQSSRSPRIQGRASLLRNQRQPGEVDEGLSQMTSALLTMLDTPEDAAAQQAEYDDEQQALTPRMGTRYTSRSTKGHEVAVHAEHSGDFSQHQSMHYSKPSLPSYLQSYDPQSEHRDTDYEKRWLPPWQESGSSGVRHENSESLPSSQSSSSSHHNSSLVGLYLP